MEAEDSSKDAEGEDKEMKDAESPAKMVLRFRKLPYTTETGEAEMIAMQFVREGGANATVDSTEKHILEQFDKKIAVDDGKGKRRAVAYEGSSKSKKELTAAAEQAINPDANLNRAEAEYMSALQAKFNAIKMMKSRLAVIIAYLQHLPPAFTAGTQTTAAAAAAARDPSNGGQHTIPSNTILRQIQALVTNVDLVAPTDQTTATSTLEHEIQRETNDVKLISLIADLVSSVNDVREAGKKFAVVEAARPGRQGGGGRGGNSGGQFDPMLALSGAAEYATGAVGDF
jgi:COP9 signalosome complex subunit 6